MNGLNKMYYIVLYLSEWFRALDTAIFIERSIWISIHQYSFMKLIILIILFNKWNLNGLMNLSSVFDKMYPKVL